jgi:hypothetical protein
MTPIHTKIKIKKPLIHINTMNCTDFWCINFSSQGESLKSISVHDILILNP